MIIEKIYSLIGAQNIDATFVVSITGFLQVKHKGLSFEMRAPIDKIEFSASGRSLYPNSKTVSYSDNNNVFWHVVLSNDDCVELEDLINKANIEYNKLKFG
jgi:hypothetical protein